MSPKIPQNANLYGIDWVKAQNQILKWGDHVLFRNALGPISPTALANSLLIDIPDVFSTPVLFTIDLEIIQTSTGLPPGNLWGAAFWIQFGAGNDVRRHKLEPGIHSVIANSLRVTANPHFTILGAIEFDYCAHCTIQEGVAPSYTWVP